MNVTLTFILSCICTKCHLEQFVQYSSVINIGKHLSTTTFPRQHVCWVSKQMHTAVLPHRSNEAFTWTNPTCCVHNIIVGQLWIEQYGTMEIINHQWVILPYQHLNCLCNVFIVTVLTNDAVWFYVWELDYSLRLFSTKYTVICKYYTKYLRVLLGLFLFDLTYFFLQATLYHQI